MNRDVQTNVANGDSDTLVGYNNVSSENPLKAMTNVFKGQTNNNNDSTTDGLNAAGRSAEPMSDLGGMLYNQ